MASWVGQWNSWNLSIFIRKWSEQYLFLWQQRSLNDKINMNHLAPCHMCSITIRCKVYNTERTHRQQNFLAAEMPIKRIYTYYLFLNNKNVSFSPRIFVKTNKKWVVKGHYNEYFEYLLLDLFGTLVWTIRKQKYLLYLIYCQDVVFCHDD